MSIKSSINKVASYPTYVYYFYYFPYNLKNWVPACFQTRLQKPISMASKSIIHLNYIAKLANSNF